MSIGNKIYGCLFCITGKEMAVACRIEHKCPEVRALVARKEKFCTIQGKKTKVEAILLPSYVFFEVPADFDAVKDLPREGVVRVLTSGEGDWRLKGEDARFARWLFHYDGLLGFSQACREGERIRIVRGPLKDMEGQIKRIDKRGRSGQVLLQFNGRELLIWLSFDLIDPIISL